ncbi:hypothetical protein [Kibdelosporangium philippinense]|uniref:hypothetical protein n=1 Tax=Kibdelosporangium philippinense TaxID=211113 RepID=UPI00360DBF05
MLVETVRIRPIGAADWAGIATLEHSVYAPKGLSEGQAVLESKANASPETCFVLTSDEQIAGYVLAMPYRKASSRIWTRRRLPVARPAICICTTSPSPLPSGAAAWRGGCCGISPRRPDHAHTTGSR